MPARLRPVATLPRTASARTPGSWGARVTAAPAVTELPLDHALSPCTGWTRAHWEAHADRLLAAVRPYASRHHALVRLPGPTSRHGAASDGLEGFARTFLLAAFRVAGARGADPDGLLDRYAEGLAAGVSRRPSPERWPRPGRVWQARVEAASLAVALHETRPWLWDRLDDRTRRRTVAWFEEAVDVEYVPNNWQWFHAIVNAWLRSVGGRWSPSGLDRSLDAIESFAAPGGWVRDGAGRNYDHYTGWALHHYPWLWARIAGDHERVAAVRAAHAEALNSWLADAVLLVGADGSPLLQGRSLIYRFAAAAPFFVGALAGATPLAPGLTRRVASGMVRHFADRGAPDDAGLLSLGWHRPYAPMAQPYSGAGSPYWAAKAFVGLLLPADDPVWTATEEPLPVERADHRAALPAPGWLVSATAADGITRVYNHGTDHAHGDRPLQDAPLYARLGYATATAPQEGPEAERVPLDGTVALLDAQGRPSHRSPFRPVSVTAAAAVSQWRAHWVDAVEDRRPHDGTGRSSRGPDGPWVTVASVVDGPHEVRLVRIDGATAGLRLHLGGWSVASDAPVRDEPDGAALGRGVGAPGPRPLVSAVRDLGGFDSAGRADGRGSPLGVHSAAPWLRTGAAPEPGRVHAALVTLTGADLGPVREPSWTSVPGSVGGSEVTVRWPDGRTVAVVLPPAP